ncbi:MAG: SusC/RagA family TonB-linked outer membrane protein [Prevotellaceae bacterium]|jgi:TonB-linked SusC/RagA family outer membrane protein|nr:SusC/RagA family TonB-linked outer membrane protein [Prevotellaceae bacterium]
MKKLLLFIALLFFSFGLVFGQGKTVSGTVLDSETKEPVIGASITVVGTTSGTITDVDGKFELILPEGATNLKITAPTYGDVEIAAKDGMTVFMDNEKELLQGAEISVAYGTKKGKGYAGKAQTITSEMIEEKNPSEITKAFAGEFAGVQVATTTGQPGTQSQIRLRGVTSFNAGTNPLYVVDGVPYGGDISSIDPTDVASTTILKDATATALYGARGANGVVLITTKKGTAGAEGRIDVDIKYGLNMRLIPLYETVTDPVQYTELGWQGLYTSSWLHNGGGKYNETAINFANKGLFGKEGFSAAYNPFLDSQGNRDGTNLVNPVTGKFFSGYSMLYTPENWAENIFHTGKKYEGTVKISGGSEKTTYFTSLGFLNDEGYYIQSDWKRFQVRSNLDFQPKKWLSGNLNIAYAYNITNSPGQGDNMNSGFQFVNGIPPIYPVFLRDENGEKVLDAQTGGYRYDYGDEPGYRRAFGLGINPAGSLRLDKLKTAYHNLVANSQWEVDFYKDLKFSATVGYQYAGVTSEELTNPYYGDAAGLGRIEKSFISYMNLVGNQLLKYQKTVSEKHNIDAFLGHEAQFVVQSANYAQRSQLYNPSGLEFDNASITDNVSGSTGREMLDAYFAQFRYNFSEKYFAEINGRFDGSSKFQKGNRWGAFGSVGASWLLTAERFLKPAKKWLTNLKLSASYGTLGNQDTGSFLWTDLYGLYSMDNMPALIWATKGNYDITWERINEFDAGIEAAFFKERLDVELVYYDKTTNNLIMPAPAAPSLGYSSIPTNDGSLNNRGVELAIKAKAVKTRNVELSFRFNLAHNKSTMVEMPKEWRFGEMREIISYGGVVKGKELDAINIITFLGVSSEKGHEGESMWLGYYDENDMYYPDGKTIKHISDYYYYTHEDTVGGVLKHPNAKLIADTVYDPYEATSTFIGKRALPVVYGGFGLDFTAYGFEFSAFLNYQLGGYNYDAVYMMLMEDQILGKYAWHKDMLNAWNPITENYNTNVPRLTAGLEQNASYASAGSTRFLTSNSALQLSNVRIGYKFPAKWIKKILLNSASVYISADNLFVITARKGYFPFANFEGGSGRSQYLPLSTVVAGIKLQF